MDGPGPRILLVEDNLINQRLVLLMLNSMHCRVDVAGNGREAVQMAELLPYDLILMDCQMPEMDGYEATARLRRPNSLARKVPIIAVTARAMKGEREKCLAAGMDDYITKPIVRDQLAALINQWTLKEEPAPAPHLPSTSPMIDALKERLGDDEAVIRDFIQYYLDEWPALWEPLMVAVDKQDAIQINEMAHRLKGLLMALEATVAAEHARTLEEMGKRGTVTSAAEILADLQAEMQKIRIAFEAYIKE